MTLLFFHITYENLISQLKGDNREKAQLQLMNYEVDADDEKDLSTYQGIKEIDIKIKYTEKDMKSKNLVYKHKKHNQYLPIIKELEEREVALIYGTYWLDKELDFKIVRQLIDKFNVFERNILPKQFLREYEALIDEKYSNH